MMRLLLLAAGCASCLPTRGSAQVATPLALQSAPMSSSDAHMGSISRAFVMQPAPDKCRRRAIRTFGQIVAGTVGAWVGGLGAFKQFDNPEGRDRKVKGDAGYTPNANTAYAIGSYLGSVAGVELAAKFSCGSLPRSFLGAALPSAVLLLGRDEPYLPWLGMLFVAPLQATGATVVRRTR